MTMKACLNLCTLSALLLALPLALPAEETPSRDRHENESARLDRPTQTSLETSLANRTTLNLSPLSEPGSKNGSASEIQDGAAILVRLPLEQLEAVPN